MVSNRIQHYVKLAINQIKYLIDANRLQQNWKKQTKIEKLRTQEGEAEQRPFASD